LLDTDADRADLELRLIELLLEDRARRHVLDYFWTAVTPGRARSHTQDGSVVEATYAAGDTRHFAYGTGEYKIHDLENVGDTDLWFTTVEFLDSANGPLETNAITDPR
jgi:beta-alanine degradation protein BauB